MSQPPWRTGPSTARRSTGITKKKQGAGCAIVAFALLVLACIAAGAVGLVFYWRSQHASEDDAATPATGLRRDAGPTATGRRPPQKRD